jgi:hypothetical protein
MILELPILDKKQEEEVALLKKMAGWDILLEAFNVTIELNEAQLYNWEFTRDKDNEVTKKSLADFEKVQLKNILLKEFLQFISDSGTIEGVKSEWDDDIDETSDNEVYDVPTLPDED